MTIGERIKKRRSELKMTQQELALKAGYSSRQAITLIEADKRDVTRAKIMEISKALHTTPAYIMGWEEENKSNIEKWEEATKGMDFSKEELEKIIDYAKYLISSRDK